jgi:hypothetical protein
MKTANFINFYAVSHFWQPTVYGKVNLYGIFELQ